MNNKLLEKLAYAISKTLNEYTPNPQKKYTYEQILKAAKKAGSVSNFIKKYHSTLYSYASKEKWLPKIYNELGWKFMESQNYTFDDCMQAASQCSNYTDFMQNYKQIFRYASNKGWMPEIIELSKPYWYKTNRNTELDIDSYIDNNKSIIANDYILIDQHIKNMCTLEYFSEFLNTKYTKIIEYPFYWDEIITDIVKKFQHIYTRNNILNALIQDNDIIKIYCELLAEQLIDKKFILDSIISMTPEIFDDTKKIMSSDELKNQISLNKLQNINDKRWKDLLTNIKMHRKDNIIKILIELTQQYFKSHII